MEGVRRHVDPEEVVGHETWKIVGDDIRRGRGRGGGRAIGVEVFQMHFETKRAATARVPDEDGVAARAVVRLVRHGLVNWLWWVGCPKLICGYQRLFNCSLQ